METGGGGMHEYRDSSGLTKVAVGFVAAYMVLELLYGVVLLFDYSTMPDFSSLDVLRNSDIVAIPVLLTMIACFIVVGMWIYRASANAHAISNELTISPGWAVGWYFVPFMNLIRPYQGMREVWLASHYRGNWHGEPAPSLLGWWWGLWIVTNILGNLSFRLSMSAEPGTMVEAILLIDLAAAALNVPLSLALIAIMRRTAAAQRYAIQDEVFA